MSKKYLITGANGQVGRALQELYPEATAVDRKMLDITDREKVKNFNWQDYDVVINAAAYINTNNSETTEGRLKAWGSNSEGVRNLAEASIAHDLILVHYSSECVFDGTNKNHSEDEPLSPLSVYGQTKAAGDIAASLAPKHYIIRTTWVVGDSNSFPRTMKKFAETGVNPKVVNDQFGRLTFVSELIRATKHILDKQPKFGIYNVTNSGPVKPRSDIASDVFRYAGHDEARVKPVSTADYAAKVSPFAPRPIHGDLDLSKIKATGFKPRSYEPLLKEFIESLQ